MTWYPRGYLKIEPCVADGCGVPTVSSWSLALLSPERRQEIAREHGAEDLQGRQGYGLCTKHYNRLRRNGDPLASAPKRPRPKRGPESRSAEEVLEEWAMLRSDGVTDLRVAAQRMGMSFSALDKALWRARKRGDERGIVRKNEDLGGIARGSTGYGQRRAA